MNNSDLIENLKVRSGKSIKFKVISIKQLLFNAQIFFLIFLANDLCHASVLIRNTEKENWKHKKTIFSRILRMLLQLETFQHLKLPAPLLQRSLQGRLSMYKTMRNKK